MLPAKTASIPVVFHRGESTGVDWESTLAGHWEIPGKEGFLTSRCSYWMATH